jgi:hypothetical protein
MKKIIPLLIVLLLSTSCGCLLSQIPPQYLYCGDDCQGVLPDYRSKVTATDNCGIVTMTQTPGAGFIMGFPGASIEVRIRAEDNSKNFKQVRFTVTLLDTIPPVIDSTLLMVDSEIERIDRLYDVADLAVYNKMKEFDATFPYEDFGLLADDQDSTYFKERLIIYSDPGKAVTGYGHRFWTFQNNDTIIFKQ